MPPSAIIGTPVPFEGFRHILDSRDLWHADTSHDTGGTDGTRADADLDAISAIINSAPAYRR